MCRLGWQSRGEREQRDPQDAADLRRSGPAVKGPHFGTVVGGLALVAFVSRELRASRPILNVRKYRGRQLSGANLAVALFFSAVLGALYFLAQQLQFVMGYSPLLTPLRLLPLAAAVYVGTVVTGFLTSRQGMKVTVTAGMLDGCVCSTAAVDPGVGQRQLHRAGGAGRSLDREAQVCRQGRHDRW
ncbi:MAG: hypothetical protein HOZ81_25460 [Streptomyces sp.]|nr:hypothetical protein [Streptomyces sp.]